MLVRIKYNKLGDISYISHLDIIKLMERIVRRTGFKLSYSEGFNPHPKTSFSPALQLGVQSNCEYLDIEFYEDIEVSLLIDKLNEKTIEGIKFLEGKIIEGKIESLVAFITHSKYEMKLENIDDETKIKIISAIEHINNSNEILLTKKTKKGTLKEYNIKDFISIIIFKNDLENFSLVVDVCSGSVKSINPKKIIELIESIENLHNIEYELIKIDTYHMDEDTSVKSEVM